MKRGRRGDARDKGRAISSDFWHARTRLDTNIGHKKRQRVVKDNGKIEYIEQILESLRHRSYANLHQSVNSESAHCYLRIGFEKEIRGKRKISEID